MQCQTVSWRTTRRIIAFAWHAEAGAQGAISVVERRDADHYQVVATVPTKPGAKTARLIPELNRYYVGVPGTPKAAPQILVFEVTP